MTIPAPALPRADRPAFFAGQILAADDLTAAQDVGDGLRRLHHRMLHGWGIASGLAVTASRGDVSVSVGAGYALDAAGRELVLPTPVTVPVPPVVGASDGAPRAFTLVLRWTPDDEAVVVDRAGACDTRGAVRRSDAPTLDWRDPVDVRAGLDIVLAEIQVQDCRLAAVPDGGLRRLLSPPPTPYIASGRTAPGSTGWAAGQSPAGVWSVEAFVDTSEAGFGDTPAYTVRIDGLRRLEAAVSPTGGLTLIDGTPYVDAAEPGRFRVVVPLLPARILGQSASIPVNPASVVSGGAIVDLVTRVLGWSVEWIGVQS